MRRMRKILFQKHGSNTNTSQVIGMLQCWMRDAANGSYIISFEKERQRRSPNQNQLMWLWFTCIAEQWSDATGHAFTKDDVHDAYCLRFLPQATPMGNIAGSTHSLDSQQMSDFLNKVQADAAVEYGIQLPSPSDEYFSLWAEQYN